MDKAKLTIVGGRGYNMIKAKFTMAEGRWVNKANLAIAKG